MLEISTNKLTQRKHVEIDGHYYIVRKIGAGDQLAINGYMRELEQLAEKEEKGKLTDQEMARVGEIEELRLELSARCFDDQEDGSKSLQLVKSLSNDELIELLGQIFNNERPELS